MFLVLTFQGFGGFGGFIGLFNFAKINLSLCLHLDKISVLLFKVNFGSAFKIAIFSSLHKLHLFISGLNEVESLCIL